MNLNTGGVHNHGLGLSTPVPGPFKDDAALEALYVAVRDQDFPAAEWSHEVRLMLAVYLLCRAPLEPAEALLSTLIQDYEASAGIARSDAIGTHATITIASLAAIRAFLGGAPIGWGLHQFANSICHSRLAAPGWLERFWSLDRLYSRAARAHWIDPDLRAFPFPRSQPLWGLRGPERSAE